MLGWYSVTSLAAATHATGLWFVTFIIGAGFVSAVTPMVAEVVEMGDETRARRVTRMALSVGDLCGVAVCSIMYSEAVLLAMGQEASVATIRWIVSAHCGAGHVPAMGAQVMRSHLGAMEMTAVQLWITLVALAANGLVNYALIRNLGAPELGDRGCGDRVCRYPDCR
jgi:MATE family multidrug resistance protein